MNIDMLSLEANTGFNRINKKVSVGEMDEFNNNNPYLSIKALLNALLSQISEQSKILLETPIYDNLVKYKDIVKKFMQEVISELYILKQHITSQVTAQKIGQKNMYFFIEKVNENLISLTEDVLRRQAKPIALASKLSFIQGLLMDMYA